jgi:hypothetical protein
MNTHAPTDLFDLMSRWDVEAKTIPSFLRRKARTLSESQRRNLLIRRSVLNRVLEEMRNAMAGMTAHYRGVVDGVVVIEADTEEECWAIVHNEGTVEFQLCTAWVLTDSAIAHQK